MWFSPLQQASEVAMQLQTAKKEVLRQARPMRVSTSALVTWHSFQIDWSLVPATFPRVTWIGFTGTFSKTNGLFRDFSYIVLVLFLYFWGLVTTITSCYSLAHLFIFCLLHPTVCLARKKAFPVSWLHPALSQAHSSCLMGVANWALGLFLTFEFLTLKTGLRNKNMV